MGDISAHFNRSEFRCKCGCGFDTVDTELLTILETLRQAFDSPITVTSGCRCRRHNDSPEVGGGKYSQHLIGRAADIVVQGIAASAVQALFDQLWPDMYGMGSYENFTHVDSRKAKARWVE